MRKIALEGIITIILFLFFFTPVHAQLGTYSASPPFISQSLPPNVMLIVDNSGSMFRFAYFDGWDTPEADDDNYGTSYYYPCVNFNPNYKYYGYFDPDYWYTYSNNRFSPTASKSSRGKNSNEWDGNFLNWLTMRRVDILRKVLTGGRLVAEGGENRLIAQAPDYCYYRGQYKKISNANLYTPFSGTVTFKVCKTGSTAQIIKGRSKYNIKVSLGGNTPKGIIQNVGNRIRWGLSFYHPNVPTPQGGYIQATIQDRDNASLERAIVNEINNKIPNSNTPLAEVLWTVTGYFAQESSLLGGPGPRYQSGDYQINNNVDPYNFGTGGQPIWAWCAKSFVILITDGEPCQDGYLPNSLKDYANGRSDFNCVSRSNDSSEPCYIPSCSGGYVPGIEDVALYAHTNDLRDDLESDQNLDIYTVFAFGAGSKLLEYTAINGGFTDKNGNNRPDLNEEWDEDGDGVPDNYYEASSGYELEAKLQQAITDILKKVASGTAVSVLATSAEGEGSLFQAFFRPSVTEGTREITWLGYFHGLWIDAYGHLREDTINDHRLVYSQDKIIEYTIGPSGDTMIELYSDSDGDGQKDNTTPDATVSIDELKPIWAAGKLLALRDHTSRTIKTFIDSNNNGRVDTGEFIDFKDNNRNNLRPYLRAADETEAQNIINFIRGEQISGYRDRELTVEGQSGKVWKLGDIVYSTPTVVGRPASNFNVIYSDDSYVPYYEKYKDRDVMVYVGANDGMLHAFWAGKYHEGDDPNTNGIEEAGWYSAESNIGTNLGEELWAYIPYNLLPHLKWLTDNNYSHVYYVDLKPMVADVKIFPADADHPNGWGTILIGGMRLGGGTINVTDDFGNGVENRTFRSAYFALDITVPQNPKLLWEFTDSNLGFTTCYPSIVKISDKWFLAFGSGPTDYDGTSSQQGKVYIIDLQTGGNIIKKVFNTDHNAFLVDPIAVDATVNYSIDVIYIGETYALGNNFNGKMFRLVTKAGDNYSENPDDWTLSTFFTTDTGQPITSAAGASFDNDHNLWVYFGTGKYMSAEDKTDTKQQSFYGIKDPCYQGGCTITVAKSCLLYTSPSPRDLSTSRMPSSA